MAAMLERWQEAGRSEEREAEAKVAERERAMEQWEREQREGLGEGNPNFVEIKQDWRARRAAREA